MRELASNVEIKSACEVPHSQVYRGRQAKVESTPRPTPSHALSLAETARKQGIQPEQLTLHADNGSPMKGMPLSQLLVDLGILKSYNRPYTSNDNPFSEAQFKTMKYRSDYPDRFVSIDEAQQ